jgi:acetyl-CoA carboxylase biotin carboxyl carrier protein
MAENAASTKQQAEENKEEKIVRKISKKQAAEASLNMAEIRELAELVDRHGFTDFEFENENIRVRLSKTPAQQIFQTSQPVVNQPLAPTTAVTETKNEAKPETPHPGAKAETEAAADENLYKITSPIVGTFYRSPSPDKDPYVNIGSKVSDDSIVCIVEAMKLMNEIQAEASGEIVKIYVENGQPVEYGQPLFGIKK